jgi:PAS domain S-box-containing protein
VQDVSARNAARQRLEEVEDRYYRLFQRLPLGLYRTTPQGEILDANPALLRMLGYADLASLRGSHAQGVFLDPADRERELSILDRDGVVFGFETRWRRNDGKEVWVQDTATAVRGADGALAYFEGAVEDIHDRKSLEAQFLQAQKMETVGQLAGGIAHDFNNLLVVVCGYSELVLDAMADDNPARAEILEILRAGQRASALTRQLLALSRRQVLEMRLLNLNSVMDGFCKMLRRILGEDVALELKLAAELDPVLADSGQMEQVLVNLAINARDAMPTGGTLIIETSNVSIELTEGSAPARAVMLSISDTGCGMSPEVASRMFEPFFTTKPQGKGTGLGLATVYGIVKQCNGEIRVQSAPDKGTTIRIYLPPADRSALGPEPVRSHPPPAAGKEAVLLVEDQDDVREVTSRLLEHLGYRVVAASSGEQALQLMRDAGPVQLVLTDVVMPEMSGTQLVERLRAAGYEFRVLYMSGHADDAMVRHGVTEAGFAFLPKPVTLEELSAKVREALAD